MCNRIKYSANLQGEACEQKLPKSTAHKKGLQQYANTTDNEVGLCPRVQYILIFTVLGSVEPVLYRYCSVFEMML